MISIHFKDTCFVKVNKQFYQLHQFFRQLESYSMIQIVVLSQKCLIVQPNQNVVYSFFWNRFESYIRHRNILRGLEFMLFMLTCKYIILQSYALMCMKVLDAPRISIDFLSTLIPSLETLPKYPSLINSGSMLVWRTIAGSALLQTRNENIEITYYLCIWLTNAHK